MPVTKNLPYSWYNITRFNNSIKVNDTTITVPPGNYSITELTVKINELFISNSKTLIGLCHSGK